MDLGTSKRNPTPFSPKLHFFLFCRSEHQRLVNNHGVGLKFFSPAAPIISTVYFLYTVYDMDLFSYVAYLVWIYEMWKKPFSKQNWLAWLLRGFPEAVVKICEIRGAPRSKPWCEPCSWRRNTPKQGNFFGWICFSFCRKKS